MTYPIDRSKWNKSTYEGHYDSLAVEYEGLRCKCKKCLSSFVFEPSEQKRQFEGLGRYPYWLPTLCDECQDKWEGIALKIKSFEIAWDSKGIETSEIGRLREWLRLIEESKDFQKKDYSSRAAMIKKILD